MGKTLMRAGWAGVAAILAITLIATREDGDLPVTPADARERCADDGCWIEAHRADASGPCRRAIEAGLPGAVFDEGAASPLFDRGASRWPAEDAILFTGDRVTAGEGGARMRYECLFTPGSRSAEMIGLEVAGPD